MKMEIGMSEMIALALRLPQIIAEAMVGSIQERSTTEPGWQELADPRREGLGGGCCRVRPAAHCQ
jgi:hypothetical protein